MANIHQILIEFNFSVSYSLENLQWSNY